MEKDVTYADGLLSLLGECKGDEARFGEVHALFAREVERERARDADTRTNAYLDSLLLTAAGILEHYIYLRDRGAVAGAATGYRRFVENFMLDVRTHLQHGKGVAA